MRGVVTIVSLVVSCAFSWAARAGDLNPPPGPVAPTMKTLEAIEPRVCVQELPGAPNATHVISEDGAYYLVADIVGEAGKHGILITADRVSLHLGPFSIEGVPGSLDGVHMAPPSGLSVVSIRGDGAAATRIGGFDGDGVRIDGALSVSIAGLTLSENGADGVDVAFSVPADGKYEPYCAMDDVATVANGGHGAVVVASSVSMKIPISVMRSCMNGGDGVRIEGASEVRLEQVESIENAGHGLFFSLDGLRCAGEGFLSFEGGKSLFNGGHGVITVAGACDDGLPTFNKTFARGVTACGNGLDGFRSEGMVETRWERCSSAKNGGAGFAKSFFPGLGEHAALLMEDCSGDENNGPGLHALTSPTGAHEIGIARSSFSGNGTVDNPASGVEIDSPSGAPDPTSGAALTIALDTTVALSNAGDGIRIRTPDHPMVSVSVRDSRAMRNDGSGVDVRPASEGGDGLFAVSFDDVFCSANGLDGMTLDGAAGGAVSKCLATSNGARGIALGSEGSLSFGVRIDECIATGNAVGIAVSGEHVLLRSAGTHNALANLSIGPDVFTGPTVPSPAWVENKPYSWP
jgi:hypothetical protein